MKQELRKKQTFMLKVNTIRSDKILIVNNSCRGCNERTLSDCTLSSLINLFEIGSQSILTFS